MESNEPKISVIWVLFIPTNLVFKVHILRKYCICVSKRACVIVGVCAQWMRAKSSSVQVSKQATATQSRQDGIRYLELYLQRFLGWFFDLFLKTFNEAQDAVLAITPLRRLIAFALAPRCQATVNTRIKDGAKLWVPYCLSQYLEDRNFA